MAASFTLRQLEYFDAVAGTGSLATAAERCHVSPTALALAIDELERRLGLQLLVRRKGKGVTLSADGTALVQRARAVLASADALTDEASRGATELVGRLTVGCFATLGPFYLPGLLDGFVQHHPGLHVDVVEASTPDLEELLLQGRADAALLYSADVSSQLSFDPLHGFTPNVIVSASHRLAPRSSVSLTELAAEPLIQIDMKPSLQNTEQMYAALGLTPAIRHTTTDYELARCLVGRGIGYSIVFQRPLSHITYDGHEIVTLELEDPLRPAVVGLARPASVVTSARYAALREFLAAQPVRGAVPSSRAGSPGSRAR